MFYPLMHSKQPCLAGTLPCARGGAHLWVGPRSGLTVPGLHVCDLDREVGCPRLKELFWWVPSTPLHPKSCKSHSKFWRRGQTAEQGCPNTRPRRGTGLSVGWDTQGMLALEGSLSHQPRPDWNCCRCPETRANLSPSLMHSTSYPSLEGGLPHGKGQQHGGPSSCPPGES